MDDDDKSYSEDEWDSIQTRFRTEGLEWGNLKEDDRLLQLYRWLADAEANLKTSRLINEKLHVQHTEEKKDLNDYTEHLRQKCEKKVRDLETETAAMRSELESLLAGTQAVTKIFLKEELHDMANGSLGQQIAYLLVERSQLQMELEVAKESPSTDTEKRLRIQLTKTCTELEMEKERIETLERETSELQKRVSLLEKTNKQIEEHNENLSYKLSEALYEIEQKESNQRNESNAPLSAYSPIATAVSKRASISQPNSLLLFARTASNSEDQENSLKQTVERRVDNEAGSLESCKGESTTKLNSFLENQIMNSKSHLSQLHEAKKLQSEVTRLKAKSSLLADKYEELVKIHQSFKINTMHNFEKEKKENNNKIEKLSKEVEQCRRDVSLKAKQISALEELKNEMAKEITKLRNERIEGVVNMKQNEAVTKENILQVKVLSQKIKLLEEANERLLKNPEDFSSENLEAGYVDDDES